MLGEEGTIVAQLSCKYGRRGGARTEARRTGAKGRKEHEGLTRAWPAPRQGWGAGSHDAGEEIYDSVYSAGQVVHDCCGCAGLSHALYPALSVSLEMNGEK